jgi:hypothetical protein
MSRLDAWHSVRGGKGSQPIATQRSVSFVTWAALHPSRTAMIDAARRTELLAGCADTRCRARVPTSSIREHPCDPRLMEDPR